jgi:hypothetical protein
MQLANTQANAPVQADQPNRGPMMFAWPQPMPSFCPGKIPNAMSRCHERKETRNDKRKQVKSKKRKEKGKIKQGVFNKNM